MIVRFWDKNTMPRLVNPNTIKKPIAIRSLGRVATVVPAVSQMEFLAISDEEQEAFDIFYQNIKYGIDPFLMEIRVDGQDGVFACKFLSDIDIKKDYPTIANITASVRIIPTTYSINEQGEYVIDDAYDTPQIINF